MTVEQTFIMIKPDGIQSFCVTFSFSTILLVCAAMKLQNVEKSFAEQQHVDLSSKPFFGGLVDYIISERQHASQPQKSIGLQSSTGNNGSCTPAPSSHNATPASSQSSGFFGMAPQPNLPLEALFSTSSRSSGPSPTAASEWHPPGAPPGHRSTVPALGNWGGGEREQDEWKSMQRF
ncbi:hypothetical protein BRADI_1g25175v3 [Brachypodium distachyon]|uniref:nucleoside-diphosphate kinase n=1 Tax=Brachypodium distachyon TaxID=15368 RepID=A0A2K2DL18_BRADI|nr:hypothetical protein BRADI_1g25175v3 [Brachypodium distachyon]